MPRQPQSKVLNALERAMLWELEEAYFDGWVIVCQFGRGKPRTLAWTFNCRKPDVYDALLKYGLQASQCEISWARGFPADATRSAQLRWLRRRGLWVQKAVVRAVD